MATCHLAETNHVTGIALVGGLYTWSTTHNICLRHTLPQKLKIHAESFSCWKVHEPQINILDKPNKGFGWEVT